MTEKELAKIAYEYAESGDDVEMFPYCYDLRNATNEEKDDAMELLWECRNIGLKEFMKKYGLEGI